MGIIPRRPDDTLLILKLSPARFLGSRKPRQPCRKLTLKADWLRPDHVGGCQPIACGHADATSEVLSLGAKYRRPKFLCARNLASKNFRFIATNATPAARLLRVRHERESGSSDYRRRILTVLIYGGHKYGPSDILAKILISIMNQES